MSKQRIDKKRKGDLVENMRAERLKTKREKDLVENMELECLERKRKKDLVENMRVECLKRKREKDLVENMGLESLNNKRKRDLIESMDAEQLCKKRKKDKTNLMSEKRVNKKRKIQLISKKCKLNVDYLDFGEMNYKCIYCGAMFWSIEFSKKSCCHGGKVVISPLKDYDKELKDLLLHNKIFRQLIRYYNTSFSFATFHAKTVSHSQNGVYNLKIQGQVYHSTPNTVLVKKRWTTSFRSNIYL